MNRSNNKSKDVCKYSQQQCNQKYTVGIIGSLWFHVFYHLDHWSSHVAFKVWFPTFCVHGVFARCNEREQPRRCIGVGEICKWKVHYWLSLYFFCFRNSEHLVRWGFCACIKQYINLCTCVQLLVHVNDPEFSLYCIVYSYDILIFQVCILCDRFEIFLAWAA